MLYIAICDDDVLMAEAMEQIIGEVLKQEDCDAHIEKFQNGKEFLDQYKIRDQELIFMDIDMPEKTGIDVIRELEKIHRHQNVVLVTGYDQLILDSLHYRPFQTIRKVRMKEDIPNALREYLSLQQRKREEIEYVCNGTISHVYNKEIEYIEKYRNNLIIHKTDQEQITFRDNLKKYEIELCGKGFLRIQSGYIVNMRYVRSIVKGEVIMRSGAELTISRTRIKMVKEQYSKMKRR